MCFSMSVGGGGYARMALRKVVMRLSVFSVALKCCRVKVIKYLVGWVLLDRWVNLLKFVKGWQNTELRAWCLDEIHWFVYLSSMLIAIMDLLSFVDFL